MSSFAGLALGWVQDNRVRWAPSSERLYSDAARKFTVWLGDRIITREILKQYIQEKIHTRDTCLIALMVIRRVLQRAVDLGLVDHNPALGVPNPFALPAFKTDTFSKAEYESMKAASKGTALYAMIVIAYNTGQRISDVTGMRWEDIDFEKQMIQRIPIKTRRMGTKMSQPIPSGSELLEVLLALRESSNESSEFVFPQWNKPGSVRCVQAKNMFYSLLKKLGIKGKCFHTFRRTWLTNLASSGCDPVVAMHMAGLSSMATLKHYVVPGADAMRAALEKAREFGDKHG